MLSETPLEETIAKQNAVVRTQGLHRQTKNSSKAISEYHSVCVYEDQYIRRHTQVLPYIEQPSADDLN